MVGLMAGLTLAPHEVEAAGGPKTPAFSSHPGEGLERLLPESTDSGEDTRILLSSRGRDRTAVAGVAGFRRRHPIFSPHPGGELERLLPESTDSGEDTRILPSPPGRGAGGEGAAMIRSPSPQTPLPGGEGLLSGPGASRLCEPCARCPCPQGLPGPETRALANRTYTLPDDGWRLGPTFFLDATQRSRSQAETLPFAALFTEGVRPIRDGSGPRVSRSRERGRDALVRGVFQRRNEGSRKPDVHPERRDPRSEGNPAAPAASARIGRGIVFGAICGRNAFVGRDRGASPRSHDACGGRIGCRGVPRRICPGVSTTSATRREPDPGVEDAEVDTEARRLQSGLTRGRGRRRRWPDRGCWRSGLTCGRGRRACSAGLGGGQARTRARETRIGRVRRKAKDPGPGRGRRARARACRGHERRARETPHLPGAPTTIATIRGFPCPTPVKQPARLTSVACASFWSSRPIRGTSGRRPAR